MATTLRPSGDKPRAGPAQTGIHPGFIKPRDKGLTIEYRGIDRQGNSFRHFCIQSVP